ncbi:PQQ-dependent sugar dehydrogenase [Microlunatus flavus]|uniref:Glucose/arabinose dehydrogenase, beta-propeller fold n=1 Tax=Microlunatus flavus TaxID=1036181 RepID=A0A1H9D971_9ACTN|nr:PQQ-dependent sugar dehydrogenase [Microlunatus flavus]SEQ09318.1 Glucose/arabinose dehydrogenase, beta-propeller fold [Microlunatus flavus]
MTSFLPRPSRRTVLLGAVGVAAGLAGCGNPGAGDGSAPSPTSAGAATPSASPTAGASPTASARPGPSPTSSRTSRPRPSPTPTGKPDPEVAGTIVDDLDVPWGMDFFGNGDALVSERGTARLLRITTKGKVTRLGEVRGVSAATGLGEGGLLGVALAPGDEDTVFAYLTSSSDNRLVRLSIARGRVGRPKALLTGIPTSVHHHGGRLLFAPDGTLFVSTGDAEDAALAQQRGSLAGKVLRVRTDGRAASGNPYGNRTWSYGHRNVEGLAFDGAGRLWATEFGDKRADELNRIVKGRNYGWPRVEGRSSDDRYTDPRATWSPTSSCSPSGLAITRSTAFVGALQGQCLFTVALDGTDAGKPKAHFARDHGRIRTVALAPDGALWMTTSNTDGRRTPGKDDDKILRVTL